MRVAMLLRRLSTSAARRAAPLRLTPLASPLLLVLHPDTLLRRAPALAGDNEQALKQLNAFLQLAARGCNNDARGARSQLLELSAASGGADVRFPLAFHVQRAPRDDFCACEYVIQVPAQLVRRTLASTSTAARRTHADPTQAPLARAWQGLTRRVLKDLFHVAGIEIPPPGAPGATPAMHALATWLAQTSGDDGELTRDGVNVAEHNRRKQREHAQFDEQFHAMLTREKNVVHTFTTGLEDGPTTQHVVLTDLLKHRLLMPKFDDPEQRSAAFRWIAGFLLTNFMELRLHALVWNKVALLVTHDSASADGESAAFDVQWDRERPDEGMGVLIPLGCDPEELLDYLYEQVDELERTLDDYQQRQQRGSSTSTGTSTFKAKQRGPRRSHFYQQELNDLHRKR